MSQESEQLSTRGIWILIGVLLVIAIIIGFIRSQEEKKEDAKTETKNIETKNPTKKELSPIKTTTPSIETPEVNATTTETITPASNDELINIEKDLGTTPPVIQ